MAMGRPRAFDIDCALDAALKVFWRKGYEGTSMPDLTEAMGISRPSLYAAFGNKEELFRKALDRYTEKSNKFLENVMSEPTARAVVEKLLCGIIEAGTCAENPRGCLLVQAALSCGEEADPIREELIKRRGETENALRKRFKRAKLEGDLPPHADPADLARFIATVMQGMAVQTASGANRKALQGIARVALQAWPG